MTKPVWMLLSLLALAASGAASAATYKCVGANGRASFQQQPCPSSAKSTVIQRTQAGDTGGAAPEFLVGRWRSDVTDVESGGHRVIDLTLNADSTFNYVADFGGAEESGSTDYAGTWQANGRKLILNHESLDPRRPGMRVDVRIIEELDDGYLRLRAIGENGDVTEYQKQRPKK